MLGLRLGCVTLEVSSNLDDSIILCQYNVTMGREGELIIVPEMFGKGSKHRCSSALMEAYCSGAG